MAIKKKGNLSFTLQAGARGPAPDSVYDLFRREEEWVGQETDLTSFLASKPKDSAHPSFGYMKLYEYSVTLNEAGMASVNLVYTGHPNGIGSTSPTKRFQKMLKTATVEGRLKRTFARWVVSDPSDTIPNKTLLDVTQYATAEINYRYYTPSVTYRYSSSTIVTSPRYAAQAASDLAGQTPTITLESAKKTGEYLHSWTGTLYSWQITNGDDLSQYDLSSFTPVTVTSEGKDGAAILSNPIIRAADLVCEQRGTFYEVEETHEIELQ
jgi:hypothetical protein